MKAPPASVDREPGVAGLGERPLDRGHASGPARAPATGTARISSQRDRDVGDDAVADLQRPGQPGVLLGVEQALRQRFGDHLGQFDGRHRDVEFVLGFDAERAQRDVGAPVVERDERPASAHVDQVRRDQQHRRRSPGPAIAMFLGTISPSSTCRVTTTAERDDERHRVQHRVGDAEQVERLLQQVRDRGFADAAQQDRADRDAQLRAGQHQRQVLAGPDDGDRALLALFGERFEAVAARRDQRELAPTKNALAPSSSDGQQRRRRGHRPSAPPRVVASVAPSLGELQQVDAAAVHLQRPSPASAPGRRADRPGRTRCSSTVSPASGMWPSFCSTRPPMVSYSPSGARNRCLGVDLVDAQQPRHLPAVAGSATTSGVASSCSSRTSPTISSIRSSTVTMPAVPPYSSTTSAVCRPLARICVITASPSSVDGTSATGSASVGQLGGGAVARRAPSNTCLTCTMPIGLVEIAVDDREAGEAGLAWRPRPGRRRCRRTASDSILDRGVISSSAVRSPNCSDRSTSVGGAGVERAAAAPSCAPATPVPAASAPSAAPRRVRCPAGAGSSWRCRW